MKGLMVSINLSCELWLPFVVLFNLATHICTTISYCVITHAQVTDVRTASHLVSNTNNLSQEPVMFGGALRTNLDSFYEHDDKELLEALHKCLLAWGDGRLSQSWNGPQC
jgi:hypothetical protein